MAKLTQITWEKPESMVDISIVNRIHTPTNITRVSSPGTGQNSCRKLWILPSIVGFFSVVLVVYMSRMRICILVIHRC